MDSTVKINRLDHLVLTVADLDATIAFYTRVLGMEVVTFGAGRRALTFGVSKINLHEAGRESSRRLVSQCREAATCASSWMSRSRRS